MNAEFPFHDFLEFLRKEKIKRFYFVYDQFKNKLIPSHEKLEVIAEEIFKNKRDFRNHEGLFFEVTDKYNSLLGAFVHRTNRGQAAGGVRFWNYANFNEFVIEGMRLSRGMTLKNSLAGLWWGGGKGVMLHDPSFDKTDSTIREYLYRKYGEFISSLRGCYVTAEDVGTNVYDMANIFCNTRFTTCIPDKFGGSGNPSIPTALGVVRGIESALKYVSGSSLIGKTIAVQGMGNVGEPLIGFLFENGVEKIIATDINPERIKIVKEKYSNFNLNIFDSKDASSNILFEECDVLAPCARGGIINSSVVDKIRAKIICGAANNQLLDPIEDDKLLFEQGICYVPDFLVNRMGIVNCANEQYGYFDNDPLINDQLSYDWKYSVYKMTEQVLRESQESNQPTSLIAEKIADELSLEDHPVFGHRGQLIIDSLVNSEWQNQ